jgi:hypothetical protein
VPEFCCETESLCERHDERQRHTDSNGCPVAKNGTDRYRTNSNNDVKGTIKLKFKGNINCEEPAGRRRYELLSARLLPCCGIAG